MMNVIFGIDNRFKPLAPYQGCVGYFANVPRALPWAILFRPFRAIKTTRSAFMQQFRRNAPGYIFSPACSRQASGLCWLFCQCSQGGVALGYVIWPLQGNKNNSVRIYAAISEEYPGLYFSPGCCRQALGLIYI